MAGFVGHGTKIDGLLKFHFEPAISKYSRPTRLNQTSQLSRFGRVTHDFRPFHDQVSRWWSVVLINDITKQ